MGQMLALTFDDLTSFAGNVLRIDRSLEPLYYRCMEATDNAVLYDYRVAQQKKADKEKAENPKAENPKPGRGPRKPRPRR